jgi:glycosyltransferase involved in cell wall biosynthesis
VPFFSIIIPTYNRYHCARRAIDSVFGQTFTDFELIIVDDGSVDNTPVMENEYRGRIKYIRQNNAGVSAARNAGISASSSPYIAFLDSDDRWLPTKLERHLDYIQAHTEVKIHQTNETWIRKNKRVNPRIRHLKKEGYIFSDSLDLCLISPSAVVMAIELFDKYGAFNTALPVCEDYDLWLKVTPEEWVGLIPEKLTVKYGGHADQLSAQYWGMDRFRIYSILNLLKYRGMSMRPEYREQAIRVARAKIQILVQGALKRKKFEFAEQLEKIMQILDEGDYNSGINYQFLLKD